MLGLKRFRSKFVLRVFAGVVSLVAGLAGSSSAWAYPNSIGFGYSSCTVCHYNPLGGGPLTDYGRALGATAISAKPPFMSTLTDEELGEASGFLGPVKLPGWIRPSIDYRGIHVSTGIEDTRNSRFIHMQAEGNLLLKFFKDRVLVSGTLGYAPVPASVPAAIRDQVSTLITREHYIAFRTAKSGGIYIGKTDYAFGLRIPDHTAFVRQEAGLDKNDQTHGVLLHASGRSWEGALHGFAGDLSQEASLRQKGASGIFELDVGEKSRVGASVLASRNQYQSRQLAALHARLGAGEGSGSLGELLIMRYAPETLIATTGEAALLQTWIRITRGVFGAINLEYLREDRSQQTRLYRAGPTLQYFPMQRLEFRVDLLGTRATGQSTVNPDTFSLLAQVHVWL